jgi:hypothetical protein
MTDDGLDALEAVRDGKSWGWRWRTPWATTVLSAQSYKSKRAALVAGRQWVREHR